MQSDVLKPDLWLLSANQSALFQHSNATIKFDHDIGSCCARKVEETCNDASFNLKNMQSISFDQCDQMWQNFATLAKFKVLGNFKKAF